MGLTNCALQIKLTDSLETMLFPDYFNSKAILTSNYKQPVTTLFQIIYFQNGLTVLRGNELIFTSFFLKVIQFNHSWSDRLSNVSQKYFVEVLPIVPPSKCYIQCFTFYICNNFSIFFSSCKSWAVFMVINYTNNNPKISYMKIKDFVYWFVYQNHYIILVWLRHVSYSINSFHIKIYIWIEDPRNQ